MILFTQLYTTIIEHQSEIMTPKTKIIGFMGLLMKIWDIWDTFPKSGIYGMSMRAVSRVYDLDLETASGQGHPGIVQL
jgi:hypothetical protein